MILLQNDCLRQCDLLNRGWTLRKVRDLLGKPEVLTPGTNNNVYWFLKSRVLAVEQDGKPRLLASSIDVNVNCLTYTALSREPRWSKRIIAKYAKAPDIANVKQRYYLIARIDELETQSDFRAETETLQRSYDKRLEQSKLEQARLLAERQKQEIEQREREREAEERLQQECEQVAKAVPELLETISMQSMDESQKASARKIWERNGRACHLIAKYTDCGILCETCSDPITRRAYRIAAARKVAGRYPEFAKDCEDFIDNQYGGLARRA